MPHEPKCRLPWKTPRKGEENEEAPGHVRSGVYYLGSTVDGETFRFSPSSFPSHLIASAQSAQRRWRQQLSTLMVFSCLFSVFSMFCHRNQFLADPKQLKPPITHWRQPVTNDRTRWRPSVCWLLVNMSVGPSLYSPSSFITLQGVTALYWISPTERTCHIAVGCFSTVVISFPFQK